MVFTWRCPFTDGGWSCITQIWVGILDTGPTGYALNSSFNSRSAAEYKQELGQSLVDIARVVPDGILVFFASYAALAEAVESWQAGQHPSIWCVLSMIVAVCGRRLLPHVQATPCEIETFNRGAKEPKPFRRHSHGV